MPTRHPPARRRADVFQSLYDYFFGSGSGNNLPYPYDLHYPGSRRRSQQRESRREMFLPTPDGGWYRVPPPGFVPGPDVNTEDPLPTGFGGAELPPTNFGGVGEYEGLGPGGGGGPGIPRPGTPRPGGGIPDPVPVPGIPRPYIGEAPGFGEERRWGRGRNLGDMMRRM